MKFKIQPEAIITSLRVNECEIRPDQVNKEPSNKRDKAFNSPLTKTANMKSRKVTKIKPITRSDTLYRIFGASAVTFRCILS